MKVTQILRDWGLILAMAAGVGSYLVFDAAAPPRALRAAASQAVGLLQPALIFCMLYLTFCRVDIRSLRPRRWHLWLLMVQGGVFTLLAVLLMCMPHSGLRVVLEGAMICLICPTATAAAVITRKLGGSLVDVTTYTIQINLLVSLLVPLLLPYVHPMAGMGTLGASALILGRVMPLLLLPLVAALLTRRLLPGLHRWLSGMTEVSFYLWIVALAMAMAVTTRSVRHSGVALSTELWLGAVSAVCCLGQFWLGRRIGARYDATVTAGQALGQKNTVLAIWMGYTFFTPVTALAGGFYSIWHNLVNSWQLRRAGHLHPGEDTPTPGAHASHRAHQANK